MKTNVNWLEVILPAGLAVAGSAVFFTALGFPTNAKIFPVGLSALLVVLCLAKIATTFRAPKIETEFELTGTHLRRFFYLLGIMVVFYLLLEPVGMYPTMLVFFLVLFRILGGMSLGRNLAMSVGITVGLFLVFDTLLGLPAPPGLLELLNS